jgi:hypothetical protein
MKANELRIGNWVNSTYLGKYVRIDGNDLDGHDYDSEIGLAPIPLTPEILEKAGFKWDANLQQYLNDKDTAGILINVDKGTGSNFYVEFYYSFLHIKHLHQLLQNLYFALTGDELEINL